ncbi:penicillin-binding protein 1A [Psychrosphaera aquimarina]|uniref:Penicillin-binding protein 1A n=1 Tax=Psychrosphaera aquimarina TaxID=2044854 RepID=A0ABU3R2J2_9GAMM|nr:penicillin-binding protein 1A [Psychrosphaera aquimarina]MDU0113891.1 penicillin-binding protein 1A [Psychrosphaera aquimarina]
MIWLKRLFKLFLFGMISGLILIVGFYFYIKDELPTEEVIRDVRFQIPMKVYTADGELISQFGEKRRIPLHYKELPQTLIDALLATEDSRFYHHYGIDPIGVLRAAFDTIILGKRTRGASTITMQFARNAFLTLDRTVIRKVKEIYIAIHIEQLLSKEEILSLYFNKTFFGNRAYGAGAAAQVYYGKDLDQLTLAQIATIAGLPKAPSNYNPLRYPERAKQRRNIVLSRMLTVGAIDKATYEDAIAQPITAKHHGAKITAYAPYVAEDVRKKMVEKYGLEQAYTEGFNVYTTIDSKAQKAAQQAVKDNIHAYDERHGYRGPTSYLWHESELTDASDTLESVEGQEDITNDHAQFESWTFEQINEYLENIKDYDDLVPAVVTNLTEKTAYVQLRSGIIDVIDWENMKWARPYISDTAQGPAPTKVADIIQPGALIWLRPNNDNSYRLSQIPDVSGAFVALDPTNGDIKASVGGYYFANNQFDRITQAKRQIGSNIKPFVYSAALENGYTLASLINDAPINKWDNKLGTAWRPKNSPPTYGGPTRVRRGLAESKNVMSVRLLRSVGINKTIEHMTRFGFAKSDLPKNESLSLGSAALTPISVVTGMSVFANGGYLVRNQLIDRVENIGGKVIFKNPKLVAGYQTPEVNAYDDTVESDNQESNELMPAPRVISAANSFLITDAMNATIWGGGNWSKGTGWSGTAWRAQSLKRRDISGKTGTTNDAVDTWFTGFNSKIIATSWLGFDAPGRPLGSVNYNTNLDNKQTFGGESGAKSALPAWVSFMHEILPSIPVTYREIPEGIISVRIDIDTGLLSRKTDHTTRWEYFIKGTEPTKYTDSNLPIRLDDNKDQIKEDDELF